LSKIIHVGSLAEFGAVTLQTLQETKMIFRFAATHHDWHRQAKFYHHRQEHEHGKFAIPGINLRENQAALRSALGLSGLLPGLQQPARPIASK
jgi:hypothetical protein